MSNDPPFVGQLRTDLLDGVQDFERRRRRRRSVGAIGALALTIALGATAIFRAPAATIEAVESGTTSTSTDVEPSDPTDATMDSDNEGGQNDDGLQCQRVADPDSVHEFEASFERIFQSYNQGDSEALVALIGDGEVVDPSLELEPSEAFPSVADWLSAAVEIGDELAIEGLSPGEPYTFFAHRSNARLTEAGIDSLSLVIHIWTGPNCQLRLETSQEISAPDPCAYHRLISETDTCTEAFEPRMNHVAVWADTELIIYGGSSGTHSNSNLVSGLAYDPATQTWRDLAPSPMPLHSWPGMSAYWSGKRMIVVALAEGSNAMHVLSYYPADDRWMVSDAAPEDRYVGPGATAFSGSELFVVGGSINDPRDSAWSFDLNTDSWRALPDPGIPEVEEAAGVWAGDEAVFYGGYANGGHVVHVAYNPESNTWRDLPLDDNPWIESHQMIWTGTEIVVVGGNAGPAHDLQLRIFDLTSESWRRSAPIPIPAAEDPGAVWTGDRLLMWGGFGTYGSFDDNGDQVYGSGAMYDPTEDAWIAIEDSPLADRCDHSGTWTPDGYVVFGGLTVCGDPGVKATGTAAVYRPGTDSWELLNPQAG